MFKVLSKYLKNETKQLTTLPVRGVEGVYREVDGLKVRFED